MSHGNNENTYDLIKPTYKTKQGLNMYILFFNIKNSRVTVKIFKTKTTF